MWKNMCDYHAFGRGSEVQIPSEESTSQGDTP